MTSAHLIDSEFLVALPASSSVMSLSEKPAEFHTCHGQGCCGLLQWRELTIYVQRHVIGSSSNSFYVHTMVFATFNTSLCGWEMNFTRDSSLSQGNCLFVVELLCIYASSEGLG